MARKAGQQELLLTVTTECEAEFLPCNRWERSIRPRISIEIPISLLLFSPGLLSMRWDLPHTGHVFPSQLTCSERTPSQTHPRICLISALSYVFLYPVQLAIKINHHASLLLHFSSCKTRG